MADEWEKDRERCVEARLIPYVEWTDQRSPKAAEFADAAVVRWPAALDEIDRLRDLLKSHERAGIALQDRAEKAESVLAACALEKDEAVLTAARKAHNLQQIDIDRLHDALAACERDRDDALERLHDIIGLANGDDGPPTDEWDLADPAQAVAALVKRADTADVALSACEREKEGFRSLVERGEGRVKDIVDATLLRERDAARAEAERLRGALAEAYSDCRILSRAYYHDSRPPAAVLKRCDAIPVRVDDAVAALSPATPAAPSHDPTMPRGVVPGPTGAASSCRAPNRADDVPGVPDCLVADDERRYDAAPPPSAAPALPRPSCDRRKIVLCGSTKFKRAYQEWNARLTIDGAVVLSVAMWSHAERLNPTPEQKAMLDDVHLAKIDDADEVFVLDVGGYTGESTRNEIAHAEKMGKPVRYLSREHPEWTEADCRWCQDAAPSAAQSSEYRRGYEAGKEESVKAIDDVPYIGLRDINARFHNMAVAAVRSLLPAPREVGEAEVVEHAKVLITAMRRLNEATNRPVDECEVPASWEALDNYPAAQAWWATVARAVLAVQGEGRAAK